MVEAMIDNHSLTPLSQSGYRISGSPALALKAPKQMGFRAPAAPQRPLFRLQKKTYCPLRFQPSWWSFKATGWSSSAAPGPLWTMYCERSCSNSGEEERIVAPIHARNHLRPCSVGRCSCCQRLRGSCGSMSDMRLSLHTVSPPTREAGALPPSLAGDHSGRRVRPLPGGRQPKTSR